MFKIKVEFMNEDRPHISECEVARIPVVGDHVYTENRAWVVRCAMIAMNPKKDEPVAYIRVTT